MPGRLRETFTTLAFLQSMACTSDSKPSTGTLPATQCTTRPRGWARTIIGSFFAQRNEAVERLGPAAQRAPGKRLKIGPPQPQGQEAEIDCGG